MPCHQTRLSGLANGEIVTHGPGAKTGLPTLVELWELHSRLRSCGGDVKQRMWRRSDCCIV